jgi:hypothetical protein
MPLPPSVTADNCNLTVQNINSGSVKRDAIYSLRKADLKGYGKIFSTAVGFLIVKPARLMSRQCKCESWAVK